MACVAEYADLSWFEGLNETGWKEVGKFKVWARANRYNLEILNGNEAILPEYIDFLKEHPYEVLPSLRIIVEAANLNGFLIDDVLKEFPVNTDLYNQFPNYYVSAVNKDRYLDLNYQLAMYLLREQKIAEGLEKLIYALKYAVAQKNKEFFMKMVPMFEQYRSFVSSEQLKEYEILMGEVLKGAEMDLGTHADH
ncbi:hypothetical protein D3C81_1283550 [compost metagenome]